MHEWTKWTMSARTGAVSTCGRGRVEVWAPVREWTETVGRDMKKVNFTPLHLPSTDALEGLLARVTDSQSSA
jgi:hypothetical protein